jgi:molybdopterin/thiamine biosynthesis adenylyltransferase/rhodanese-related sulfurtransferase
MLRYAQQSILPEIGNSGQKAIHESSVLCVGAGGLGSSILLYLAAAGVGRLGIVDDDQVELSNLHRQVLFNQNDIGTAKVLSAKDNLEKLNSNIFIETFPVRLAAGNVERIFSSYDIIIDGTDNFYTKYLINDAAVKFKKPVIFGSATGFEGQVSVFDSSNGPCYRCLYPSTQASIPNCAEAGVLGPVVGIIGSMQAAECLKFIVSKVQPRGLQPLVGKMISLDARDMSVFTSKIAKNEKCEVCSLPPEKIILTSAKHIQHDEILKSPNEYVLIDVREQDEWNAGFIPGAIHFPLSVLKSDFKKLTRLDPDKKIVAYCQSGVRSAEATRILTENGFTNVYNLFGYSSFG